MRNNMKNMLPQRRSLGGFAAFTFLLSLPGTVQAQTPPTPPKQFFACYVPSSGVIYRIKEPGLKNACTGKKHVEFSWAQLFADNDGKVGIGTDNPAVELEVNGTVAASAFASTSPLIFEAPVGTIRMYIDDNTGNVGIGTPTPNNTIQVAGLINFDNVKFSTMLGFQAGNSNSASHNSFVGYQAGLNNISGSENSFVGYQAGLNNISGSSNSFVGSRAGLNNISGTSNSFVGTSAGRINTSGSSNSFVGASAGRLNTSGSSNSFVGYAAGLFNTSGSRNTFMGKDAGQSNTIGTGNVFLGYRAGFAEIGSNKLIIANSGAGTPLIHGDFTTGQLTVAGTVESTSGGFKFPDGSIQTSAAGGAGGPATDLTCTTCVEEAELVFDPATQTELDGHAAIPAAHHSPTGVNDVPVNGSITESISSNWAFDHGANASVHHSRYTDAEAIAAVGATSTHGILTESKTVELGPLWGGEQIVSCPASHTAVSGGFLLVSPGTSTWGHFHHAGSFKAGDSWKWKFWNESTTTTFTVLLQAQCILKPAP